MDGVLSVWLASGPVHVQQRSPVTAQKQLRVAARLGLDERCRRSRVACADAHRPGPLAARAMHALTDMSVLEHLRGLALVAHEFSRVLTPGDVAVVCVPVSNLLTETILRLSYLSVGARAEDEHVPTHFEAIDAFRQESLVEDVLNIPCHLPERFRIYSTVPFRKAD